MAERAAWNAGPGASGGPTAPSGPRQGRPLSAQSRASSAGGDRGASVNVSWTRGISPQTSMILNDAGVPPPHRPRPPVGSRPASAGSRPASAGSARGSSSRPGFMGGRLASNSWCRATAGDRALEDELRPTPLSRVDAREATPIETQFAMALGIMGDSHWPRLPLEVGGCEQGNRCCWRWLARAALEQVAGEPMSHMGLPDMLQMLREDMTELRNLRRWQGTAVADLEQAAQDRGAHQRLRNSYEELEQDLRLLRSKEKDMVDAHLRNVQLESENAKLRQQGMDLRQEVEDCKAQMKLLIDGELKAAKNRAENAEKELLNTMKVKHEDKVRAEDLRRSLEREQSELDKQREENLRLRMEYEALVKLRTGGKKKKPRGKSAPGPGRSPTRRW
eukprot:TRINITY_DN14282_c0_g1_i1.p1 TRINITY_DN14282_c0_g1~~TRINITY_DN14282_c0_g1_i1.p1  ORF type:complete len:391 (-),score=62.95 TRINITY_DN14282_c0_g1_i1:155-1327(-)